MLVYKATNKITGKSYVGFTSKTLEQRKSRHYTDARSSTCHFHHALNKYDKGDWEWEELGECETLEDTYDVETQKIQEYDSFDNGYNSTTGAWSDQPNSFSNLKGVALPEVMIGFNKRRSDEYKYHMSESKKKYFQSEEGIADRKSRSEKMKEFWASPTGQKRKEMQRKKCGRPQSEEKKQTDSERMKKIWEKEGIAAFNRVKTDND